MIFKSDEKIYYPLGGASYVFEKDILHFLLSKISKKHIKISIGAQPNSSPHFGTLTVFCLAFATAEILAKTDNTKSSSVLFEVVDTAPSEILIINNLRYQKNLKQSGIIDKFMKDYIEILEHLKLITGINYEIRYQSEFNKQKKVFPIIKNIIQNKNQIKNILDPKHKKLRLRVSCPVCGLSDKNSINNSYNNNILTSYCPRHGEFTTNIKSETDKLEYNTPLRNLIRALVYSEINQSVKYDYHIIRVTGSDYAGFYQEELLYKVASKIGYKVETLPIILYAPLILDWSGAKLSKSLYVKDGAYKYLPNFLINYEYLKKEYGIQGLNNIYNITSKWINNPYMLFRHYSVYYFIKEFDKMNEKAIYISIKPQFTKLIESGEKNYEFRKYIPKNEINTLYVYESAPTSSLKYIIKLGKIIEFPNKIDSNGYGNKDFNNGLKKSKYAYEIKKVYKLKTPIPLMDLKYKYNFNPPQAYSYDTKYPDLTNLLKEVEKDLIIDKIDDF